MKRSHYDPENVEIELKKLQKKYNRLKKSAEFVIEEFDGKAIYDEVVLDAERWAALKALSLALDTDEEEPPCKS